MAQITDREIQDTFTEADKLAVAWSFPANTLNATNENVLNPPPSAEEVAAMEADAKAAEEAEANLAAQEAAQKASQEAEQTPVEQPKSSPEASAPQVVPPPPPTPPAESADDEMMSQDDIDALIRQSAAPKPLPKVEPDSDAMMSPDEIAALIQQASSDSKPAAVVEATPEPPRPPVPEIAAMVPAPVKPVPMIEVMDEDEGPLSPDQIQALVDAANSSAADDADALLSHDDIQALIAKTKTEVVATSDMFDTREAQIPVPAKPANEPKPVAVSLETAVELEGKDMDGLLSQSGLADMMRKANLEPEPTPVSEYEATASQSDLDELIKKTERITKELSKMDGSLPLDSGKTQADGLIERKQKREKPKAGHEPQTPSFLEATMKGIKRLALTLMFGIICGSALRVSQYFQEPAPSSSILSWKWERNPDAKSSTMYRFSTLGDFRIQGTLTVVDSDGPVKLQVERARVANYYVTRYQEDFYSIQDRFFGEQIYLVDYIFPHPSGSPDKGFIAKRSVYVAQDSRLYRLDFLAPVKERIEATPGKEVWQQMNRVLKDDLNIDPSSMDTPDSLSNTVQALMGLVGPKT